MAVTVKDIHDAINKYPCLYEDQNGNRFIGETVSKVPAALRDNRWRGISRDFKDEYFLRRLGCDVRTAQYVGGVRPTGKFVNVVYVRPYVPAETK